MSMHGTDTWARRRAELLRELVAQGVADARVLEALERVPREEFVPAVYRDRAYENCALPIESGQTISQPLIVGWMTQLLRLTGRERVLEIGTGSGYQAAVLSLLAAQVYSIELDPLLGRTATERLARLGFGNVRVRVGDGYYGWPEEAPFDAVILTAVAPRLPENLMAQLKPGGVLVLPLEEEGDEQLVRVRKAADGSCQTERLGGVAFVPMRGAIRSLR